MIFGGKGGSKTKSGLEFESRSDLKAIFEKLPNYKVQGNDLFFTNKLVAHVYKKHEFYNKFLKGLNVNWKGLISKQLLPDESIFVISNNRLFIIEMKFQKVQGSVDEKLQTCDFKKRQYQKLLSKVNIKVEYVYVLDDWFKHGSYVDVLNYIESVGCHYFFKNIPLKFLELPE